MTTIRFSTHRHTGCTINGQWCTCPCGQRWRLDLHGAGWVPEDYRGDHPSRQVTIRGPRG